MIATSNALDHYFCVCCSARLDGCREYCANCKAPLQLSQSLALQGGGHEFISVLGASNAGKTVYMGLLLDILSKGGEDFRGSAASPFSVELQEHVVTELENRCFPEKTPSEADSWQWLHCKLNMREKKSERTADLISPDFAGEAIAMEVSQPGLYPAVENVVKRSTGILMLCDSVKVRDEGSSEDLFAMKLATYIADQHNLGNAATSRGKKQQAPSVAIVFTKCDECPEAVEDPRGFAEDNASRLLDFCEKTFPRIQFFAAGIAGSTGILHEPRGFQMCVPFHVQPFGLVEPLKWILKG